MSDFLIEWLWLSYYEWLNESLCLFMNRKSMRMIFLFTRSWFRWFIGFIIIVVRGDDDDDDGGGGGKKKWKQKVKCRSNIRLKW